MLEEVKPLVNTGLIEREKEDKILSIALVAKEHVIFVGDKGTAKTLLAEQFFRWVDGKFYATTLGRTSDETPLFGPMSIKEYREGRYGYEYKGTILDCDYGFINEGFDANDNLLRTLLDVLNERRFQRGTFVLKPIPLQMAVMTANYTRLNEVTAAFVDRFLFKWFVTPVVAKEKLIGWEAPKTGTRVTPEDLEKHREKTAKVTFSRELAKAIVEIGRKLKFSDRTITKSVNVVQATAHLSGRARASWKDLFALVAFHSMTAEDRKSAEGIVSEVTEELRKKEVVVEQMAKLDTFEAEMERLVIDPKNEDSAPAVLRAMNTLSQEIEKLMPEEDSVSRRKNEMVKKAETKQKKLLSEAGFE